MAKRYLVHYTACFAAFFCVVFLTLAIEGKSLLWTTDGLEITYPLFAYEGRWIRRIVRSLFLSGELQVPMWDMSIGMGSDVPLIIGSNPFNLLSALFPMKYSEWGADFVVGLELYLAGLAFSSYGLSHKKERGSVLAGSMMYSFGGWAVTAALRQHLFVAPLVFWPLLLVGADRVFERRSPVLFIVFAALLFWTYFYLAYMACIALFAYCVYCFIRHEPKKTAASFFRWFFTVIAYLAVAALIAGVAMLPTLVNVFGQGRLAVDRSIPLVYPLSYYARFVSGFVVFGNYGADAFIGFGALGFLACVALFLQRGRRALKVAFLGATLCMLVPYAGHLFNGFSYVTNRWAWIYSFLVAFIFADMLPCLRAPKLDEARKLTVASCVYMAAISLFPNTRSAAGYASAAIMLLYLAYLSLGGLLWGGERAAGVRMARMPHASLLCFLAVSLAVPSFFWISDAGTNWAASQVGMGKAYGKHMSSPSVLVQEGDDGGLWRFDKLDVPAPRNNTMLLEVDGFDWYTPLYNENLDRFLGGFDLATMRFSHSISGLDRRSFLEAALGARWFLTQAGREGLLPYGLEDAPVSSEVVDGVEYRLYRNGLSLPIGYFADKLVGEAAYAELDAVERQQVICQSAVVEDSRLENVSVDGLEFSESRLSFDVSEQSPGLTIDDGSIVTTEASDSVSMSFEAPGKAETYVWIRGLGYEAAKPSLPEGGSLPGLIDYLRDVYNWAMPDTLPVTVSDSSGFSRRISVLPKTHHMYTGKDSVVFNLGYRDDGATDATLTFEKPGRYTFEDIAVVSQPVENLESGIASLRQRRVDLSEGLNSYKAHVDSGGAGVLCLSVPWSEGWKAIADGEEVEVLKVNEAFLGVALPEGEHDVVFRYESPWVREGALMSLCGMTLLACIVVFFRLRKGRKTQ